MDELKPCPFCGNKMQITTSKCITADGPKTGYHGYCAECGMHMQTRFSEEQAIADVNRRAAPENKPLTLEELQGMARDLMSSCVVREAGKSDCIAIIDYDNISKFGPKNNIIAIVSAFGTPLLEKDYGKSWLAYARKPEESNPLMNELREKLNQLEAEVTAESGDAAETYTNGYIWGHRNGQIELLRRILKTDEGGTIKLEGSEKP